MLAACSDPLAPGAPDLRGLWRTLRAEHVESSSSRAWSLTKFVFWNAFGVERERIAIPEGDYIYGYVERIEQCGNRIVDAGGGTIADARADGTEENGVHDVSAFDYETPIQVIATFEDGVFVLRPANIPFVAITRRLDTEGHLVWHRPDLGDRLVTLERIGGPCDKPPGTDWARFPPSHQVGGPRYYTTFNYTIAPEPGTAALLAVGLAGLGAVRRGRARTR